MIQKHLNLQLSDELLCYLLFYQQALFDYFQSTNKASGLFSYQVNSTVLTVSQLFYLLEIVSADSFAAF